MDFLIGIAVGCAISLLYSFGPAFFSLLQTSVHYGFRRAVPFAFGVNLNDILIVFLMLTVLQNADMHKFLHNPYVSIIGGLVLILFGIYFFTRKVQDAESTGSYLKFKVQDAPKWYAVYSRGFIINFINPMVWIYWLSVITLASSVFRISTNHLFVFFSGVLLTTVSLDVLKCKLASMLQRFLTARILNIMNKVIGVIVISFAIYLIVSLVIK